MHRLPGVALLLGIAGLVPFAATGLGAVASIDIVDAARCMTALLAYGAVILAFLGGVHWGFVLGPAAASPASVSASIASSVPAVAPRIAYRLCFGVLPALVGWVAMLIGLFGFLDLGVLLLVAGFIGITVIESELSRRRLVPSSYMWLRWGLSSVVVIILIAVLLVRLLGGRLSL